LDIAVLIPYFVSIAFTLGYASLGKLSSGEDFDLAKFAKTIGVQITAMAIVALASAAVDISSYQELIALLPTLVTVLVMKLYAYITKSNAGVIPLR
jgi:predicted permease